MACDCVFAAYFTLRPRPKQDRPRRAPLSIVGILLQSLACALLGSLHRRPTRPIVPVPLWVEIALAGLASVLAAGSLWLCIAAVVTLGRQWTYIAAVGEDHQLVTRGPYARVRHPIYAGMTGLVIATAIVVSRWWAAPIIVALQLVGTWIRANQEDRLLREAHGQSFADYAANVPAIVPRLWRTPGVS
jgi:protein-S-isoprenylcysteine O-methyltransferase Ste14